MCFNEFCECTGDLSISTETEVKKYTKRSILEQRKTYPRSIGADAVPSIVGSRSIGSNATIDRRCFCATRVYGPIDRMVYRDRSVSARPFYSSSLQLLPIDRLLFRDRSAMALSMWSRFPLLQNVPFCVLFHLGFRTCA